MTYWNQRFLNLGRSHEELIARCSCGVIGCGSATARISERENSVVWDNWGGMLSACNRGPLVFENDQYLAAVEHVLSDHSWETPDRTAARLLREGIDRQLLADFDLRYEWASGRVGEGKFTISLLGRAGQTLLYIPWLNKSPEEIARMGIELLRKPPKAWNSYRKP